MRDSEKEKRRSIKAGNSGRSKPKNAKYKGDFPLVLGEGNHIQGVAQYRGTGEEKTTSTTPS